MKGTSWNIKYAWKLHLHWYSIYSFIIIKKLQFLYQLLVVIFGVNLHQLY